MVLGEGWKSTPKYNVAKQADEQVKPWSLSNGTMIASRLELGQLKTLLNRLEVRLNDCMDVMMCQGIYVNGWCP